jgi:hypothetical protein
VRGVPAKPVQVDFRLDGILATTQPAQCLFPHARSAKRELLAGVQQ